MEYESPESIVNLIKAKLEKNWFWVLGVAIVVFFFPFLLCPLIPLIFFFGIKRIFFPKPQQPKHDIQRIDDILEFALTKNGRVTAAEISAYFDVDIETAEKRLDQCVEKGQAQLMISQSGIKVYRFHHIISEEEKGHAESV